MKIDLSALLMEIVHAQEPFGHGWSPEAELWLSGVLLGRIVIDVLVELKGKC